MVASVHDGVSTRDRAAMTTKPSSSKSLNNNNSTTYMMTPNAQGTSLSPTPQYSSNNMKLGMKLATPIYLGRELTQIAI